MKYHIINFRKLRKPYVTRIHMNLFASILLQCFIRLVIYGDQVMSSIINDFISNYKLHIQAKLFARKLLHVKTNLAIKLFTSCRHEYKHTLTLSSTQHSWLSEVIWNWFHF